MTCDRDCFHCKYEDCINDEVTEADEYYGDYLDHMTQIQLVGNSDEYKARKRESARKSKAKNAKHYSEYNHKYYEAHKEERKEYLRLWYAANKEKSKARQKAWYAANREKANERLRQYRARKKAEKEEK